MRPEPNSFRPPQNKRAMSEPITPQLIKLGQRLSRNNIVRRVYLLFKILNGYDIKLQIRSIEGYLKTNLTYEQAETKECPGRQVDRPPHGLPEVPGDDRQHDPVVC